jgi:predicted DNA-binding transcriptional regulator AlpA
VTQASGRGGGRRSRGQERRERTVTVKVPTAGKAVPTPGGVLPAASGTGKRQQPPGDDVGILGQSAAGSRSTAEPEPPATGSLQVDSLISIREIRALFGLGRTAAYELTHRPGFPAPVRVSPRCYRWWQHEVAAFTADLRRQAQPGSRQRPARQAAPAQDMPTLHITGKVRLARSRKEPP